MNNKVVTVPMDLAPAWRRAIDGYCNQAGFQPRIVLETQLQQTIIGLVAEDLGIALVPAPVQNLTYKNGVFKSITTLCQSIMCLYGGTIV